MGILQSCTKPSIWYLYLFCWIYYVWVCWNFSPKQLWIENDIFDNVAGTVASTIFVLFVVCKPRNIYKFRVSFGSMYNVIYQVMSALFMHATGKHDVKHINKIKLMSCSDRIHYRDGYLLWDLILPKSITMISIIVDIWKCGSRTLLTNGNKSRNPALG